MKKIWLLLFVSRLTVTFHTSTAQTDTVNARTQVFNADSATEQWLHTLTPVQRANSDSYFEGGYWLSLWNVLYLIFAGGVFLLTGLSRRMKALVSRVRNINIQTLLY